MADLDPVTKSLPNDSCTLAEARLLFDEVINDYLTSAKYLASDATIVRCKRFELVVSKIQSGRQTMLTKHENVAVTDLVSIPIDERVSYISSS